MKKKLNNKQQLISYVLSTDAELNSNKRITQEEIGKIFGVSQSTIAQANKETAMRLKYDQLQQELNEAKREIRELQNAQIISEEIISLPDFNDTYKRKW